MKIITTLFISCLLAMASITASAADAGPDALLIERAEEVMGELKKDGGAIKQDMDALYGLVNTKILPLVDFEAMSKLILSTHWKKANPEQRGRFMEAFKNLLVNTYTQSLKQYANQDIVFFPERTRIDGKYATVYSEFVPGNGQRNVPVVYKLRKTKDAPWKAYNLELEGLSVVKNFRTDFNAEINSTGLDSLIARLEKEQAERRAEAAAS